MSTTESSASAHPSTYRIEEIAQRAEAELERLRQARPALASRIDRAEGIVCRQLGSPNGYRPIRIVIHPAGDHSYVVRSDGKLARSYTVDPHAWGCDCPDHRRRRAACKHAIACWILRRAFGAPAGRKPSSSCDGCGAAVPRRELVELDEDNHDNLTYFHGDLLCRGCARDTGIL